MRDQNAIDFRGSSTTGLPNLVWPRARLRRPFIREHKLNKPEQLFDLPLIQSNVSVVQWPDWFLRFTTRRAPEVFTVRFDRAQMDAKRSAVKAFVEWIHRVAAKT